MYPFNGWVSNESSPAVFRSGQRAHGVQAAPSGPDNGERRGDKKVCFSIRHPLFPKSRWRYQMVNMYPGRGAVPSLQPNGHALGKRGVTRRTRRKTTAIFSGASATASSSERKGNFRKLCPV